ncbi:alkylhydroperoxidase AhpD family core domain-containing protein [Luteibacter sp. UNCMF331Sha3.1]|uniref:carboxymuconolactone decarboxylase family protein n=1 Tax=Luteibacter sp. UNCMF331Sha3.1 TaxID=1502760 RepID=UPI0008AC2B9D|nr:carboxymuconolactone decarboxylase family protein [Luteibacter sp. UNCMF331Sha3.1]SEN16082.1 alkylhydroperoxidase AhpD family core domain-containing protein [Luteibacter sp. UNCMF331Sha3.1]
MSKRINYMKAAPDSVKGLIAVHGYLAQSGLDGNLVDLVYLRVSQINNCAYCIDMHSQDLVKHGVPFEKLILTPAWREAGDVFTAREQAALAWAESLANVAQTGVPDEDYAAASAEFNEKELSDLSVAIALMSAFNRLGVAFRNTPAAASKLARAAA